MDNTTMKKLMIGITATWTLLGCGAPNNPNPDAGGSQAACEATYQSALNRSCSVPADCTLVSHSDCCGTVKVGVRAGTQAAAMSAEATYQACFSCGARGCFHADQAEDGKTPGAGQSIVATCVMSRCTSVVQ
jgi:hypothetical protein